MGKSLQQSESKTKRFPVGLWQHFRRCDLSDCDLCALYLIDYTPARTRRND